MDTQKNMKGKKKYMVILSDGHKYGREFFNVEANTEHEAYVEARKIWESERNRNGSPYFFIREQGLHQ